MSGWACKRDGHIWNLAAEKCTMCGLAVSDVKVTREQYAEFDKLNDTVKNDNFEIVVTLKIKTYGTREQAEKTFARFKSEVALQHFEVTYGTEFIKDSKTPVEQFSSDYMSQNAIRSILDRTFGEKVDENVDFPTKSYTLLDESTTDVDDFRIYQKIAKYTDSSIQCEMIVLICLLD